MAEEWNGQIREHFFSRNEYARKLYFYLYPLWLAMHIWDWFVADHFQLAPQLSFGFSTLTQYPSSIGTNNPTDGSMAQDTDNSTWATIQSGAGNYKDDTSIGVGIVIGSGTNMNTWIYLSRATFCFDTSALTSSAIISSAILSLYGTNKSDGFTYPTTPNINIYASTPASTSSLATSDFTQIGSTALCDTPITYAGFSTSGYNDFNLNANGIKNINKTGISCFGARNVNYDVNNTPPYHPASGQQFTTLDFYTAKSINKPKLVVTYIVGTTYTMNTLPASFSLTGEAITPSKNVVMPTLPATFSLIGQAITFSLAKIYTMVTAPAVFVLTGMAVKFKALVTLHTAWKAKIVSSTTGRSYPNLVRLLGKLKITHLVQRAGKSIRLEIKWIMKI